MLGLLTDLALDYRPLLRHVKVTNHAAGMALVETEKADDILGHFVGILTENKYDFLRMSENEKGQAGREITILQNIIIAFGPRALPSMKKAIKNNPDNSWLLGHAQFIINQINRKGEDGKRDEKARQAVSNNTDTDAIVRDRMGPGARAHNQNMDQLARSGGQQPAAVPAEDPKENLSAGQGRLLEEVAAHVQDWETLAQSYLEKAAKLREEAEALKKELEEIDLKKDPTGKIEKGREAEYKFNLASSYEDLASHVQSMVGNLADWARQQVEGGLAFSQIAGEILVRMEYVKTSRSKLESAQKQHVGQSSSTYKDTAQVLLSMAEKEQDFLESLLIIAREENEKTLQATMTAQQLSEWQIDLLKKVDKTVEAWSLLIPSYDRKAADEERAASSAEQERDKFKYNDNEWHSWDRAEGRARASAEEFTDMSKHIRRNIIKDFALRLRRYIEEGASFSDILEKIEIEEKVLGKEVIAEELLQERFYSSLYGAPRKGSEMRVAMIKEKRVFLNELRGIVLGARAKEKLAATDKTADQKETGGIDFNSENMDMSIWHNGDGVIIPRFNGTPEDFDALQHNMQGLVPVIFDVAPVVNLPLLLGLNPSESDATASAGARPDDAPEKTPVQQLSYFRDPQDRLTKAMVQKN